MAKSLTIPIYLGGSKTGLTLRAQIAGVGSPVTAGFTEHEHGDYSFAYASYPDNFTGRINFYDDDTDEYLSGVDLNPADFGSVGGSGDDPLENLVPGSYASGTAGAALGRIGVGTISVVNALTPGGDLYLYVGDSYLEENGNALDFTDEDGNWPDLTGLEVRFLLQSLDIEAEVVTPTGSKLIRVELSSANTDGLAVKKTQYALKIIYPGIDPDPDEYRTIVEGRAIVRLAP
jgi:hypothetical protein